MKMEDFVLVIIVICYGIWSIRWGLRFFDGRWSFLEAPNMKVVKIIVSVVGGVLFGIFYFIFRVIKFIFADLLHFLR